jgi:hypothetical protein
MKTLYRWEKIVLIFIAFLSLISAWLTNEEVVNFWDFWVIFEGVISLFINTLIVFALFKLGNRIFKSKKTIAQAVDIKN